MFDSRAMRFLRYLFLASAFLPNAVSSLHAQTTNSQNVGLPTNASLDGTGIESVQTNNGNLHIEIPLFTLPGRGLSVPVSLVYDSKGWVGNAPLDSIATIDSNQPGHSILETWRVNAPLGGGQRVGITFLGNCGTPTITKSAYYYQESNGTTHSFPPFCSPIPANLIYATDGSGYAYHVDTGKLTNKAGVNIYHQTFQNTQQNVDVMEDVNGNKITRGNSPQLGFASTVTDTLGRPVQVDFVLNSSTGKYELPYYDASGTTQKIIMTKSPLAIQTSLCSFWNYQGNGCNEYSSTWQVPTEIDLPNGMKYVITYNQNSYGTPSSIQLPTGATISYTYGSTPYACTGANIGTTFSSDDSGPRVTSRTITNGGQVSTWNYIYVCNGVYADQTVVNSPPTATSPNGDDTVHSFIHLIDDVSQKRTNALPASYETQTDYYSGLKSGGMILKSVQTVYQDKTIGPHLPVSVTTTWPQQGNLTSRTETDWDTFVNPLPYVDPGPGFPNLSWGNPTEKREYAFGAGAYGALARKTDYKYAHISGNTGYNVSYVSLNIADLVTQKTVYDGSSAKLSDAKMVYDGTGVTATTGVPNHDSTIGAFRGNATQPSVWLNTTNTWLSTNNTYNDLGHVLTTQDPGLHTLIFSYTDSWSGATCGVGTNTQAFLTQTSAPDTVNSQGATVHHRAQTTYFPCTGQKQSTRDENDILAARPGTAYTYDLMLRPSTVTHTDGGQTTMTYGDTANAVSVATTTKQDSSHNIVSTSYHDGLGRVKQTQLADPNGDTFVDTTYDLLSRVSAVSNPHRAATSPTDGITTYQYDALGRKILEIPPDGTSTSNNVITAYGAQTTAPIGLATTVTDQASKKRMSVTDALGRLVDVWEPSASSSTLVNETTYGYDLLNNLLRVDQKGNTTNTGLWRTRTSTYDSLSRLLTTTNPESGQITWTYDADSNVLTKKDARNNTITYNYDQLHRVATVGTTHAKTYSNGDHFVDYYFDQTSYNGLTITEGVGHQTGMADATGSSASKFDIEGRAVSENQTINITGVTTAPVTKALAYTYKLDGSIASLTYPSGHLVNYAYDTAGHPSYAIDPSGPIKYVTSTYYAPHGDLASYVNGVTAAFAGIKLTNTWNNRFQPQSFIAATLGTGAHNVMSLAFNFNQGTVGAPIDNGILVKITNNLNTGRTTNYSYDQLNRIIAGWHDATDWGAQYTVDIWGNLTQKAPCNNTVGCPTRTSGEGFSAGVNGNNQFNTYSYDASGNLQNDQLGHTFVYDAENRPSSETQGSSTVSYYYDGAGERVAKSSGKLYWFGTNSAPLVESDASGAISNEYIFFNGKRVAMRRASDNSAHYYFADQIGSANVVTNATGTMPPEQDIEYHPYGEQQVYSDTLGQEYRFTGHEHDPETNDDYFDSRYYSSTFGRFLTPDWSASPEPIPYAAMGNPQTLNLYSYVENNPITGTDPDGHCTKGEAGCTPEQQAKDEAKKIKEQITKQLAELKAFIAKSEAEFREFRSKGAAKDLDWFNEYVGFGKTDCAGGNGCDKAVNQAIGAVVADVASGGVSEEATLARSETKIVNLLKGLAKEGSLEAAEREANGGMKIIREDGKLFEHAEKYVSQHIGGLEKQAKHLERFIREHPGLSDSQKQRAISAIRFARDTAGAARVFITPRNTI